jgi:hypothetical protein
VSPGVAQRGLTCRSAPAVTDTLEQISALLHKAGETHHRVFRIVDGADDDWASW